MNPQNAYDDRIFKQYYMEVGRHSLLTAKEERALLLRYKTCPKCNRAIPRILRSKNCIKCGQLIPQDIHSPSYICPRCSQRTPLHISPRHCVRCGADRDIAARDRIIEANLKFVMKVASSFTKNPEYIRKLASAGNVGLMIALDKFNVRRGTRFLTYAASWIRKEILDELHASGLVRVPSHKQKTYRKEVKQGVYVCEHCHKQTLGFPATLKGLGRCVRGKKHNFRPANDPEAPGLTTDITNMSLSTKEDIEHRVIDVDADDFFREVVKEFPTRERDKFILLQYYDVPHEDRKNETKNFHQLAAIIGITPERVRQIKEKTAQELCLEFKRRAIHSSSDICL